MLFTPHYDLQGQHAFLSASRYHWINYDEEKLVRAFASRKAAQRGTDLHAFAHEAIRLGIKLPKSPKTMHLYVNDAIGYRMKPEVIFYHSPHAFGTADTASFRRNLLRIFDLKTGMYPSSVHQLQVYAAFFCLEYKHKPTEIGFDLRIYQRNEVQMFETDPEDIARIMETVVAYSHKLDELMREDLA